MISTKTGINMFSGNNLVYLDPHSTQPTVNPQEMSNIPDGVSA